jgi:hypothetical protein
MSGVCCGHAASLVVRLLDGEEGAEKALIVAAASDDPDMRQAVMGALIAYASASRVPMDWEALEDLTWRREAQMYHVQRQRDRWFGTAKGGVSDESKMAERARAILGPVLLYRDYYRDRPWAHPECMEAAGA